MDEADVPRSNSQSAALGIVKSRLLLNCLSDSQCTAEERVSTRSPGDFYTHFSLKTPGKPKEV